MLSDDGDECKYFDTCVTYSSIGTSWNNVLDAEGDVFLNNIHQGKGAQERDGRRYYVKAIQLQGRVRKETQTNSNPFGSYGPDISEASECRVVLIHNKMANSGAVSLDQSDIFQSTDWNGNTVTPKINRLFVAANLGVKFDVIMDRTFVFNPMQWGTWDKAVTPDLWKYFSPGQAIRWKHWYEFDEPLPVNVDDDSGDLLYGGVNDNIFMLFSISTDAFTEMACTSRIHFYDSDQYFDEEPSVEYLE